MKYEIKKIDELLPYVNNARTHSEAQVAQIAASIKEFGFINPVLIDKTKSVIAGHGRLMAARKLGLKEIPCVSVEHLTKSQQKAYIIADNKLAENAGWDKEILKIELEDLKNDGFDLDLMGYSKLELDSIFFDENFNPGNEDEQGQLDKKQMNFIECVYCGGEFEEKQAKKRSSY